VRHHQIEFPRHVRIPRSEERGFIEALKLFHAAKNIFSFRVRKIAASLKRRQLHGVEHVVRIHIPRSEERGFIEAAWCSAPHPE